MKARDVLLALLPNHPPPGWAAFHELPLNANPGGQRIDLWAIECNDTARRWAYEVKVSRADFLSEIRQPDKRRPAMQISNHFMFAAPLGLIRTEEIPGDCGLIEVDDHGGLTVAVPAPYLDTLPPTWRFLAAVARRVANPDRSAAALAREEHVRAQRRLTAARTDTIEARLDRAMETP